MASRFPQPGALHTRQRTIASPGGGAVDEGTVKVNNTQRGGEERDTCEMRSRR